MDNEEPYLRNIEWHMMDKTVFFPLSMLSHFCIRGSLYPLTLIKTRLQLQKNDQLYKGEKCFYVILFSVSIVSRKSFCRTRRRRLQNLSYRRCIRSLSRFLGQLNPNTFWILLYWYLRRSETHI